VDPQRMLLGFVTCEGALYRLELPPRGNPFVFWERHRRCGAAEGVALDTEVEAGLALGVVGGERGRVPHERTERGNEVHRAAERQQG